MKILKQLLTAGCILYTTILYAQGQPKLELVIEEQKVNMTAEEASGEKDVIYSPGDTIEYTIYAKNTGTGVMVEPEIMDPIPEGLSYVANSAFGENCQIFFSINDGLQYSEWPIMVQVESDSGAQIAQRARPDQVTHIKWIVNERIPAGSEKILSFRAVVQ
ncbi:MAG: DUF11 domain-containing protein [bacterium]